MDLASLKVIIDARGAEKGSRRVTRAMDRMKKSSDKVTKSISTMQKVFYSLGASIAIEVARRYADAWTSAANKLKVFINNSNELVATQHKLFNIANRTWQSYDATVTLFSKMLLVQKPLNASMEDMYVATEAVGKAVALSGATAATASGALLQLGQALSSGRVYAEEFNSIIEGTPRLAIAVAEGLGYASVGFLKKAIQDGKVASNQLLEAIISQAKKLDEEFKRTSLTTSAAFQILSTSVQKLIGEFDTSKGVTSLLSDAIVLLAENLELVAKAVIGLAAAFIAVKFAAFANGIIAATVASITLRRTIISNIAALKGLEVSAVASRYAMLKLATAIQFVSTAVTTSSLFKFGRYLLSAGAYALRFAALLGGPVVAAIALVASGTAAAASSVDHWGVAIDIALDYFKEKFGLPFALIAKLPAAMKVAIKEMVEYLTGWDLDEFTKKIVWAGEIVSSVWGGLIDGLKRGWRDFVDGLTPDWLKAWQKEYDKRLGSATQNSRTQATVNRELTPFYTPTYQANAEAERKAHAAKIKAQREAVAAQKKAEEALRKELTEGYEEHKQKISEILNPLTDYEKGLEFLNKAQKAGAITANQYAESLERLKQAYAGERIGALIREGNLPTSAEVLKGIDIDAKDNYNSPIPRLVTEGQDRYREELRTRDRINEQAKSGLATLQREVQFKRELLSANREDRDILRQKFELEERLLGLEGYTEEQIQSIRDATEESNRLTSILTEQERIADQFTNVWDSAFR